MFSHFCLYDFKVYISRLGFKKRGHAPLKADFDFRSLCYNDKPFLIGTVV